MLLMSVQAQLIRKIFKMYTHMRKWNFAVRQMGTFPVFAHGARGALASLHLQVWGGHAFEARFRAGMVVSGGMGGASNLRNFLQGARCMSRPRHRFGIVIRIVGGIGSVRESCSVYMDEKVSKTSVAAGRDKAKW